MEMSEENFLIKLGSTAKQLTLPGDIFHAARILGKCNKSVFHCHVFFLIWAQFLKTYRIERNKQACQLSPT
jgi:hypothetical protein